MIPAKKIVRYFLSFFAVITLNFVLPRAMPGDPVMNLIGEDVYVSETTLAEIRSDLGLDRPFFEQYLNYLWDLIHFDLGHSYHLHREVSEILFSRMEWTLLFVGLSVVLGAFIALILGALAGWESNSKISRILSCTAIWVSCTPPYFLAMLFLYFFAFKLGLFPFKGFYDTLTVGSVAHHLFLPITVMTLFTASRDFLIMRGSVYQEKQNLYVLYAKAKGLYGKSILFKHVLQNASLPLITLVALDFGFLFSGALFIEIIFSLNGMGQLIYNAIMARDYPILQGALLLIAVSVVLVNLAADILYSFIDPRVRSKQ
jgi:peptide/nickel transport system permease protein